jgi:integrase
VRDRRITANPCEGTRLPKVAKARVEPLPVETVRALAATMPGRYRALVTLAAGTGMRQGECLGRTVDRVDFLRRLLTVDRQLVTVPGLDPYLGPPKTAASVRTIPLPQAVLDALALHLRTFPADDLVLTSSTGTPIRRTRFGEVWRDAVKGAGAPHGTGFNALRHFHASLLIRHGERQDGAGEARPRQRSGDARHLLAPLAGQQRPDPSGRGRGSSCGLRAD